MLSNFIKLAGAGNDEFYNENRITRIEKFIFHEVEKEVGDSYVLNYSRLKYSTLDLNTKKSYDMEHTISKNKDDENYTLTVVFVESYIYYDEQNSPIYKEGEKQLTPEQ